MENKKLIKELVKLQILCMRWVERNTNLKCSTHRDIDNIIMSGKLTINYEQAVKNLRNNIEKYCQDSVLFEQILVLEKEINKSEIKKLRFGVEPQKKFSELEKGLDTYMLKRRFFMLTEMVGIKNINEEYGLTISAVKQACQQQRLLNTQKVGNNWLVHIPEVLDYWNIKDENVSRLYKDWLY